jgi:hypothetical protein
MPKQKDLKRVVRARMQKTGESYTTARLQLVKTPAPDYAALAGMSDDAVQAKTGRNWRQWVALLDAEQCAEKPHREIARYVSSLGTPDWWSQTVTVGYERIRGLRAIGQRRDGGYEAGKSRTYNVAVGRLYQAFVQWLSAEADLRSATANKRMRVRMPDDTVVEITFTGKSPEKSAVAIQHTRLPNRAAVEEKKAWWAERLDALREVL